MYGQISQFLCCGGVLLFLYGLTNGIAVSTTISTKTEEVLYPSIKCNEKCLCSDGMKTVVCTRITSEELQNVSFDVSATETLTIQESELYSLSRESFKKFQNLETLDLSRSGVKSIPTGAIDNLEDLRRLILPHNNIRSIGYRPTGYLGKYFKSSFTHIPTYVQSRHLREVDLSGNQIYFISEEEMRGMKFIQSLNLSGNYLTELGSEFNFLMGIKVLDLSGNRIVDINGNFGGFLLVLEDLYLSRNRIPRLPYLVSFYSSNLRLVDLSKNLLTSVESAGVMNSATVKTLKLSENKIEKVTLHDFQRNENLRYLDLSQNEISSVQENSFAACDKLEELDLSNNFITEVSPGTFRGLSSLKVLNIEHNRIHTLEQNSLSDNIWLNYLYLRNNKIEFIHQDTFKHLPLLLIVDLRYNTLTVPSSHWFQSASGQYYIDKESDKVVQKYRMSTATFRMDGNHWRCDCSSTKFFDWASALEKTERAYLPAIQCQSPYFQRGQVLLKLSSRELNCDYAEYFKSVCAYHMNGSMFLIVLLVCFYYIRRTRITKSYTS